MLKHAFALVAAMKFAAYKWLPRLRVMLGGDTLQKSNCIAAAVWYMPLRSVDTHLTARQSPDEESMRVNGRKNQMRVALSVVFLAICKRQLYLAPVDLSLAFYPISINHDDLSKADIEE